MNQYLSKIDSVLEADASLKKLNKKPWNFSPNHELHKICKNNICSKFVKCKDQKLKEVYHSYYKIYRNLLSALLKRAKEKYFANFFNEKIKDIKKT